MALIGKKDQDALRKQFNELRGKTKIIMFEAALDCPYCPQTKQILEEVSALSDKIEVAYYNFHTNKALAETYNIDKIPALVLLDENERDYGIRFFGIPSGYEFSTLIEDIIMLSTGETSLGKKTLEALKGLAKPVHLQVFVTPTCPYCPAAVRFAHMAAFVSDQVRGDMVEAQEFPDLSQRFSVYGVPKTIINDVGEVEGAVPELRFMDQILQVIK